jgi:acyl carrier protein
MNLELRLQQLLAREIEQAGGTPPANIDRSTILASTGLDSLGFATMIVAMQKEFDLDPFGGSDDIIYPESFGELLDLYQGAASRDQSKP